MNFNVSARTARLIGRENFANAEGAIIELVKNTYDADSRMCFVVFDVREDKQASSIFIIDHGEGMTEDVILKHWMTIGTDDKLNNAFSKNGRVKSGAKGIGRFALDRLGKKAEMITFSEKTEQGLLWTIDWADFEKEGYTLADINASLDPIDYVGLGEKVEGHNIENYKETYKKIYEGELEYGIVYRLKNLKSRVPHLTVVVPIKDDIKFIGASIGASDKAETIVNDLETKLSEIKAVGEKIEDADKKSVLFLLSVPTDDAPTIYSIGKNTFLDEILSDIGAKNVTGDMDSWVSISEEDAVAKNPDVILHSVSYVPEPEKAIMERKGWENVKAVKDKAVYYIDENASNRPNAHVIDAVYQMAKKIYPEQFKDFTDPFEKAQ